MCIGVWSYGSALKKVVVFAIPGDFQRRAIAKNGGDGGRCIMIMRVVSRKEGASGSLMVVARLNIIRQKLVEMPSTFHKTETFPYSMRHVHFCHWDFSDLWWCLTVFRTISWAIFSAEYSIFYLRSQRLRSMYSLTQTHNTFYVFHVIIYRDLHRVNITPC